jgi:hypothetical protein
MKEEIKQLQEKAREEFNKEVVDYFWDKKTICGTQRLSINHIEKIIQFQNTLIEQTYKQGAKSEREQIGDSIFSELPEWNFKEKERIESFLRQWFALEWHNKELKRLDKNLTNKQ